MGGGRVQGSSAGCRWCLPGTRGSSCRHSVVPRPAAAVSPGHLETHALALSRICPLRSPGEGTHPRPCLSRTPRGSCCSRELAGRCARDRSTLSLGAGERDGAAVQMEAEGTHLMAVRAGWGTWRASHCSIFNVCLKFFVTSFLNHLRFLKHPLPPKNKTKQK